MHPGLSGQRLHLLDEAVAGATADVGAARTSLRIAFEQDWRVMGSERRSTGDRDEVPDGRMTWNRENAARTADRELAAREERVRLRELALDAPGEAEDARADRERLLGQLREANEKLVIAIVEAQQLADEANAARAAAAHNEERFRSLIDTSSALVWTATPDGRFELDLETWREFTGVDLGPGEAGWLEAVHPDDRERVRQAWSEAVATAMPYTCQHRIRSRGGGYAWVVARAVPVPKTGIAREWIGMMTDVTDRVRVEQAREQFIGILGHDLRNPLAAILMAVELLGEMPEPSPAPIAQIARSAHRIEAMIRDLLDFARGRLAGGIPIAPKPCDLQTVCSGVVEEMQQAHPARAIRLDASGDLRGEWDLDRVEQVVSNLVANAVSHGTGAVRVTACDGGDEVVMTVHNDGRPIPAAVLPILFEPFTRSAAETGGAPRKGLGLGLYIASEIVHAHGATISVTSTASQGTTFTIRWPRSAPRRSPS
ncbi:MAG TPA: ATP-binding protein [Kofleriaceae bacterium]|nr:ATP-binding protein [Kofleriaceae bacterium]